MRVFIGFFIPENIRRHIVDIQSGLGKLPMLCKMVEPHNLHVSLSFLGNLNHAQVEEVKEHLSKTCRARPRFEVEIGAIKIIPNEKYIRVIVLEVSEQTGILNAICSDIKKMVGGSMKPPHLTLCRVRSVSDKEKTITGIKKVNLKGGLKFDIDAINLIKSELEPSGPRYDIVYVGKLNG